MGRRTLSKEQKQKEKACIQINSKVRGEQRGGASLHEEETFKKPQSSKKREPRPDFASTILKGGCEERGESEDFRGSQVKEEKEKGGGYMKITNKPSAGGREEERGWQLLSAPRQGERRGGSPKELLLEPRSQAAQKRKNLEQKRGTGPAKKQKIRILEAGSGLCCRQTRGGGPQFTPVGSRRG